MSTTTTPVEVTKAIAKLCRELAPETAPPVFVPVEPVQGAAFANCFPNVAAHVEQNGGALVHGWAIWEWPGVFVEAEFHGVWKDGGGRLVDLTPKGTGETQILFLPDPSRRYEGRQINNIRRAVSTHAAVRDFIAAADAQYELLNRGARGELLGEVILQGEDADEMRRIQEWKVHAEAGIWQFILNAPLVQPARNRAKRERRARRGK